MIYTAIAGSRDNLKQIPENLLNSGDEFVAFVEDVKADNKGWKLKKVNDTFDCPNRNAKIHKVLPFNYTDSEYSLWIDGNITPHVEMDYLIKHYLRDVDWAVFKHPADYMCAYVEAETCKRANLDSHEVIDAQMSRYKKAGFPKTFGLQENTIILRRHTDKVKKVCNMWWEEIQGGSKRDQLSFDYVRWVTGLKVRNFPGCVRYMPRSVVPQYGNPYFTHRGHNK